MKKEVLAGLTTFSTMAYILIVNPLILSEAGIDFSSAMLATLLLAFLGCTLMGTVARYPLAIAPGVGLSAYFTYSVVIGGGVAWQTALGLVFLTGLLLLILWVTGLRELIIDAIPKGLKIGTTAGVGLFLVVIGLKNAEIIISHPQTLLTLGNLARPEVVFVGLALALSAALMSRGVSGALLIGIFFCWASGLVFKIVEWKGIFALPAFSTSSFFQLDIAAALSSDYWMILFSFLFICLFDVSGSLMGLAHQGKFLDKAGKLPRLKRALFPDAVCTTVAGLFGSSACAIYIESAAGIGAGGRKGATAITVGFLFLLSLFFEPLASSIPLFAVTPVLVTIGALMLQSVVDIDWKDPTEFIPAFVTVVGIPLTYSVGVGIGLGILLYPLCKLFAGKWRSVHWLLWILAGLFAFQFVRG
ncbi:MAG: NCS2 family permease [Chlamydiales bacterium]